jgi:hypothetical protein
MIFLYFLLAENLTKGNRLRFWCGSVCGNIRFRISQKIVGEQIRNNHFFLSERKKMVTELNQEI